MNNNEKHVFLDIETLGVRNTSAVVQIGAVIMDNQANILNTFECNIDIDDASEHGTRDKSTMTWWRKQSAEARKAVFGKDLPRVSLEVALLQLAEFIATLNGVYYVWGNSPSFDCAILNNAYSKVGLKTPWVFWRERDCRTVAYIGEVIGHDLKDKTKFDGVAHNGLDDAIHQGKYTLGILRHIEGKATRQINYGTGDNVIGSKIVNN